MPIIRMEGDYAIHAHVTAPGLTSKVLSRQGKDGKTYVYHVVQDELSWSLERTAPEYQSADFQVKDNAIGPYSSYASSNDKDLKEYLKRHRALVDLWHDLYRTEGDTLEEAVRASASNKHVEPNRQYGTKAE